MSARLENKVAFLTGAGRGIGRAIAYKMAHEGAMVALADIDFESAQSAAEGLQKEGCQAFAIPTDITRETDVQAAVSGTIERFGRVDILVNNAGKNFYYDATTMSEADWDNAMDVDVKGAWLCCKHILPSMKAARAGSIINIASVHARITTPKHFPYAAAKSALMGLTRNLAECISYISQYMTLKPGDVISTGTPEGVVMGVKEKNWLKPADEVVVDVEGLGKCMNGMV